ncbi:MAG: hypothetical protein K6C14_06835 [Eubacterium sp.]|nr:hypothetical protein [Eubacterium sp.]
MFKLESNRIKREFKIVNGNFFASQILNKYSGMSFIPDGNGCEFVIRFADGGDFSAKGLRVIGSSEENGRLKFIFEETQGVSVTLEFWVHSDGNTICKQLTLNQSDERVIDFIHLDSIGIINSQTHLGVDRVDGSMISPVYMALGQPFYIDSLFFGCEFPATDNRIVHGTGRVKYYIGKSVGRGFKCPVTVMGAAKDNTVTEVKKAFFDYLESITLKSPLRFQFNCWYDNYDKISENSLIKLFGEINESIKDNGIPQLDAYTVDDGWQSFKTGFWGFNKKTFPEGFKNLNAFCTENGSRLGMWLSPRGGYSKNKKYAKKLEKAGNGFMNKNAEEICVASPVYLDRLGDFLISMCEEYGLAYLKLDGFALKPCEEETHYHNTGGADGLYYITDLWQNWIKLFAKLRGTDAGKDVFINMTSFANLSPWWLQWVNYLWLQNSGDIGFSPCFDEQKKSECELTYRDARYYDTLNVRMAQLPLSAIYNHEPIYGKRAEINYSDEEFRKYLFWNAARGAGLNELHLSSDMMSGAKWSALKEAMEFSRESVELMRRGMLIGGNPEDGNIYGYIGFKDNEGLIALRNPTDEPTELTLTFNYLMGAPETLRNAVIKTVYGKEPEGEELYGYDSKLSLTLGAEEIIIFKLIGE